MSYKQSATCILSHFCQSPMKVNSPCMHACESSHYTTSSPIPYILECIATNTLLTPENYFGKINICTLVLNYIGFFSHENMLSLLIAELNVGKLVLTGVLY